MKAELITENVGGLKGKYRFELRSGALNIIESPNALGKSTIIKSLAAVLSLPCTSPLVANIAHRMGIKNKEEGSQEPLVNVDSEIARIILKRDGEQRLCEIQKTGKVTVKPEGIESFLLTSVLTRETEITRRLIDGESNFEWIVKNISFAEAYEKTCTVVERWLNLARLRLDEITVKSEQIVLLENAVNELRQSEERLKIQISEAEQKLKAIPSKDPFLEATWEKIKLQLQQEESNYQRLEQDVKEDQKQLILLEKQLNKVRQKYEEQLKGIEEVEAKIKGLPTEQERDAWNKEIAHITEIDIPKLSEEKAQTEGVINLYERAIQIAGTKKETLCPLCEEGMITIRKLEVKKAELQGQLASIESKLASLINRKNELLRRITSAERDEKKFNEELRSLRSQLRTTEWEIKDLEGKIRATKARIEQRNKELEASKNRISELRKSLADIEERRKELGGEEKRMIELIGRLRNQLESVRQQIEEKEREIWERSISSIEGIFMSLGSASKLYQRWIKILEEILSYMQRRAKEQKRGAVRAFNAKVKDLMEKLGFSEFEDIWINEEDFELHVIRRGKKSQPIASLSASEKYAIATLLQLTVKETYMSDNPFFIIDELVLDFDPRRVNAILEYLSSIARERDWFVVLAKIGESDNLVVRHI